MKKITAIVLLSSLMTIPFAEAKQNNKNVKTPIYLSYCSHYGPGVSYSFQSCVNSNMSSIESAIGGITSYCSNFGTEVSYSFISCINSNFTDISSQLGNTVYLQYCSNFDRNTLDYTFVSCVNSNFETIESEITANHK